MFDFDEYTAHDSRIFMEKPAAARAVIKASDTWVFQEPDPASARLTQFTYGERVTIHAQQGNFYHVQSQLDLYCGWVHGHMLREVEEFPLVYPFVTRFVAPVTREPDLKSPLLAYLPPDAHFSLSHLQGDYCKLSDWGWVHHAHIQKIEEEIDPIQVALGQLGRSYVWGGRGLAGLDCSALVQLCYRFAGRALPRDSDLQEKYMSKHHLPVNAKSLNAGDLIFIPGHVMIASSAQHIIHASGHHMRVVQEPLLQALKRYKIALGKKFQIHAYHWKG